VTSGGTPSNGTMTRRPTAPLDSSPRDLMVVAEGIEQEYMLPGREMLQALGPIDFSAAEGEFVTFVGPSGCGKTTLLRVIGGITQPTAGRVSVHGRDVSGPSLETGIVFQNDRLLPWQTVYENVALGLRSQGLKKNDIHERVGSVLALVGLERFVQAKPPQLSGGMRQRVNLARALAIRPKLLLMDEPFAALDHQTRELMQEELLRIWGETGATVVFVTHQIDEAVFLADRVVVFTKGPGQVRTTVNVDFERPRDLSLKRRGDFQEKVERLWTSMEQDLRDVMLH